MRARQRGRRDQRFAGARFEEFPGPAAENRSGAAADFDSMEPPTSLPAGTAGARARAASLSASDNSSGLCGYDARFESPLDKKYVCPVCLAALRDPLQTKCGHRFCKTCLIRASGRCNVATCPLDKLMFDFRNEVFEDVAMRREVLSLHVLCFNMEHGCEWIGELRLLEEHNISCPHEMVLCINGCLMHHKRVETEEHHRECPSRLVDCPYCHHNITFKSLKQHQLLLCPRYSIECPLCGKPDILREDMPKHTDNKDGDCPKSMVPCEFREMGCHAQVSRCDLQLHKQESLGLHMDLLLGHYTDQMKNFLKQGATVGQLEERCSQLVCQKSALDSKVAEMGEEMGRLKNELSLARTINHNGLLLWKVQICSRDFTAPILSPPFYTSNAGYKLRLCLELRGHVTRSDSYTSLFVVLCCGENDDSLYFPFSAVCSLMLFDQGNGENHMTTNITCQKVPRPQEITSQNQRRGRLQFMKTDTLINGRFCKAGTLFFQARVTTIPHPAAS